MLYVDTSALVKLYVVEAGSREVAAHIREHGRAIPRTPLHELEFENAIHLKRFRREFDAEQARRVLSRFDEHLDRGVYYYPPCQWSRVWAIALDLAREHTRRLGSRSLDILHVAVALEIGAERFLTFDERQAGLATASGLERPVAPPSR